MLVRRGLPAQYRDEALAALTGMDKVSRSRVLLDALAKVPPGDPLAADKLLALLFAQPAATLRTERDRLFEGDRRRRRTLCRARRVWRDDDRGRPARSGLAGRDRTRRSDPRAPAGGAPAASDEWRRRSPRAALHADLRACRERERPEGSRAGAGRPRVDPARRRHIRSSGAGSGERQRRQRQRGCRAIAAGVFPRTRGRRPASNRSRAQSWPGSARSLPTRDRSPTRSRRFSSANGSRRSSRLRQDAPSGATCGRWACAWSASRPCRRSSVSTCAGSPSRPASPCRSSS